MVGEGVEVMVVVVVIVIVIKIKRRMYCSAVLFVSSFQKYIRIGTVANVDGNEGEI